MDQLSLRQGAYDTFGSAWDIEITCHYRHSYRTFAEAAADTEANDNAVQPYEGRLPGIQLA